MKQRISGWVKTYVPRASQVFVLLALVAAPIHLLALCAPPFADWFQRYVASAVRGALGLLTGWLPFSLAEAILLSLLPLAVGLILLAVRLSRDRVRSYRMLSLLVSFFFLLYAVFVFTFGVGYATTPMEEQLSLDSAEPTADDLKETTEYLVEQLRALEKEFSLSETGASEMPYSYRQLNRHLRAAYLRLSEEHTFLARLPVGTKRILLSGPMAYTGITGVYTFFTGEANVNTTYPDYATAFTAAHEMAHQRGVAREDEANFVAFLACIHSEDAFLRYAGYLNLLQYVSGALYTADRDGFYEVAATYPSVVRADMRAYNEVYDRYDGALIGDISEGVNNSYLHLMGTEGTVSYSLVVRLCVAYLRPLFAS